MKLAMVAADYTPGEADQLRRDMAAWRRGGDIEKHSEKLISRMEAKGISREFAKRVFDQIRGFGEYGFPESHAASFALLAYLTAWLKHHYHDVFTAALLNAWPMGFYAPATIVDDARRHGVEVRPADVNSSRWFCTLEPAAGGKFAVRIGLRFVKGLAAANGASLIAARAEQPFTTVEELAERLGAYRATESLPDRSGQEKDEGRNDSFQTTATVPKDTLKRLAEAGALNSLNAKSKSTRAAGSAAETHGDSQRRDSLWRVLGTGTTARRCHPERSLELTAPDPALCFNPLDRFGAIVWDYIASGMSTRGHPLEPFRHQLSERALPDARRVSAMEDGRSVFYAGLVICRQRPITTSGVVFMTLEDEAGFVNLVVWPKVFQRYRPIILTASFIGVSGRVQVRHNVVHIVADRFWTAGLPTEPVADHPAGRPLPTWQTLPLKSRDFH